MIVLIRPVCRPIDGGGASRIACRLPEPARSTREEATHVLCGMGSWGGRRLRMHLMSRGRGKDRATAAGGRMLTTLRSC